MTTPQTYPFSNLVCAWLKIYTLSDENGNVFYVGCTTQRLETRLAAHMADAKSKQSRKAACIRKLNYKIIATIVDMKWITADNNRVLRSTAIEVEKIWIEKYFDLGYPLVNGGRTVIGLLSPEYIGKTIEAVPSFNSDKEMNRVTINDRNDIEKLMMNSSTVIKY